MNTFDHYKLNEDSRRIIRDALILSQMKLEQSVLHLKKNNLEYLAKDSEAILEKVNIALSECSVCKLEFVYGNK